MHSLVDSMVQPTLSAKTVDSDDTLRKLPRATEDLERARATILAASPDSERVWTLHFEYLNVDTYICHIYSTIKYKHYGIVPKTNFDDIYYAAIECFREPDGNWNYELRESIQYEGIRQGQFFIFGRFHSFTSALKSLAKHGNTSIDGRLPKKIYV